MWDFGFGKALALMACSRPRKGSRNLIRPHLLTWLLALAFSPFMAGPAVAQDDLAWHGSVEESSAALFYGIPGTDYGPLSFTCSREGDGLTFTYIHEPIEAYDGVEVEVLLQAGDIEVPIRTFGWRLALDDTFVLEGKAELDDRLIDLLTSRGMLFVFVGDGVEEFPLEGAREAAAPLIETCRGQEIAPEAADVRMCDISAWFNGTGPEELDIRAAPRPDAPVIGSMPPPYRVQDFTFKTEMEISGFKQGWFRISQAFVIDYIFDEETKVVFNGEGWVQGDHLGLLINHRYLYEKPSSDAMVVADLSKIDERAGPDSFAVQRLHACAGSWVEVEGHLFSRHHRGWTRGTCSNQVTTCP